MKLLRILRRQRLLALTYFLATLSAVTLTRFDGGVAFLWGSSAILIATLLRTPRRRWAEPVAVCALMNIVVTAVWGLGPALAIPMTVVSCGEAVFAAWLLQRHDDRADPMQSLGWFVRFVAIVGIVAPLATGIAVGALLAAATGKDFLTTAVHVFTGHALGSITFTPLALLITGRKAQRETWQVLARRPIDAIAIFSIVFAVTFAVFWQSRMPLLFLPVMVIILATFRLGRVGSAMAVAIVALAGGLCTALGHGPVILLGDVVSARMLFFQFYLATTVLTVLPVSADLHSRRKMLRRIRLSEERFRMMAEHSADILMHVSDDGRVRYVSSAIQRIAGYQPEALVGVSGGRLVDREFHDFVRNEHAQATAAGGVTRSYEYIAVMADGTKRWFMTHSRAILDEDGRPDGIMSIVRDIHDAKARVDTLESEAMTDQLTSLPNRRALVAHLERMERDGTTGISLALLDIDHFKRVNDQHGHDVGDAVLRQFALIAKTMLREGDFLARVGGEEFVVVLPRTRPEAALALCDRLRAQLAYGPVIVGRVALSMTVSGGVALLGKDGLDAALKAADVALYDAKRGGRDQMRLAA